MARILDLYSCMNMNMILPEHPNMNINSDQHKPDIYSRFEFYFRLEERTSNMLMALTTINKTISQI